MAVDPREIIRTGDIYAQMAADLGVDLSSTRQSVWEPWGASEDLVQSFPETVIIETASPLVHIEGDA